MIYYNISMTYYLDLGYIIMVYFSIVSGYSYYDLLLHRFKGIIIMIYYNIDSG